MPPLHLEDARFRADFIALIAAGNYRSTVCKAMKISQSVYSGWVKHARAGEEPYASFIDEVQAAEATAEVSAVKLLLDGALKDWRAAAEYLRRGPGAPRWNKSWQKTDPEVFERRELNLSPEAMHWAEGLLEQITDEHLAVEPTLSETEAGTGRFRPRGEKFPRGTRKDSEPGAVEAGPASETSEPGAG